MKKYLTLIIIICFITTAYAQNYLLQSGPMVGYSQMREVALWVQTTETAFVYFAYWDKDKPEQKFFTYKVETDPYNFFMTTLIADQVEPGVKYQYQLYINDEPVELNYRTEFETQKLWQWREDPPEFTFGIGSCAYINEPEYDRPGTPYGGDHQIFTTIYNFDPDFFIWMGDNSYLREVDWHSRTGIYKRLTHDRSSDLLQSMLGSMHHYATWDDHDYGPNNSDRSFWAKELTREAFTNWWANPSYGVPGAEEGIATYFEWADCAFFLLDDRTYRSPEKRNHTKKEMLGEAQIEWLLDAMSSSYAPFKFVVIGSTVLNPDPLGENYSNFTEEKKYLLDMIAKEKIEGVIFLTGDIHRGELTKIERSENYPLYEITSSPLSAGVSSYDQNVARLEGTLVHERNFGLLNVSGPRKNRTLNIKMINADGEEKWNYTIKENELKIEKE
ncbi:MAG: alkaline phosphatase family protein [Ignavibacteriales bacterium]|jgi:alkaline phosphatase D|nr:MAG: alkaline phosphatase family protein [Ignavibacteriales bacterium]